MWFKIFPSELPLATGLQPLTVMIHFVAGLGQTTGRRRQKKDITRRKKRKKERKRVRSSIQQCAGWLYGQTMDLLKLKQPHASDTKKPAYPLSPIIVYVGMGVFLLICDVASALGVPFRRFHSKLSLEFKVH